MSIETAIKTQCTNYTALFNLVGDRVYPVKLKQDTAYPAICFFRASSPCHHDIRVSMPRFQFSCYAKTYAEAKAVATQVKNAFQRYKGVVSGVPIIQGVLLNEIDLYESETGLYHIPVDIKLLYKEV